MKIKALRSSYEVNFLKGTPELLEKLSSHNYDAVLYDEQLVRLGLLNQEFLTKKPSLGIQATEDTKTYLGAYNTLEWMSSLNLNRSSTLVVIGGGVVQDIATFISGVFHRGINWIYVPTTLLSQADSCIGGKCGINLNSRKNQIGLIYPPNEIYIVESFLNYLPKKEIESGIGEVFKMSLISTKSFWPEMKKYLEGGNISVSKLVNLSLIAKKEIIENDEFELHSRKVLNYGHTFGHAIESASNYAIPHGVAVLLGMRIIHSLGCIWGITDQKLADEIDYYISIILKDTTYLSNLDLELIQKFIWSDKKINNNELTFIVLKTIGVFEFVKKSPSSNLTKEIEDAFRAI